MPVTTTYAQAADLTAYTLDSGVAVPSDPDAKGRLINRAELDIDSIVGPWAATRTVGFHTLPTGTINVEATSHIPMAGTLTVAGQAVTYTGITSKTLTGATGGTGEIPEGSPVVYRAASGLKFDPVSQLTTAQALALKRATCAQAEYRLQMGEPFFIQAEYSQTSGPDFSQSGQLPKIGPKVFQELRGYGLVLETVAG